MQREIRQRVKDDLLIRPKQSEDPNSVTGIVSSAMNEVLLAMEQTRISLDMEAMAELVEKLGQARRIVVLAEGPAQPTAYSLVLFLEQGGFPVYIARAGIADLARTVNIATPQDLAVGHGSCRPGALYRPRNGRRPGPQHQNGCHHWFGFPGIGALRRYGPGGSGSPLPGRWDRID